MMILTPPRAPWHDKAIQAQAGHAVGSVNKGFILYDLKQWADAETCFTEALRTPSDLPADSTFKADCHVMLASTLGAQGNYAEALDVIEQALQQGLNSPWCLLSKLTALAALKRMDEAIDVIRHFDAHPDTRGLLEIPGVRDRYMEVRHAVLEGPLREGLAEINLKFGDALRRLAE